MKSRETRANEARRSLMRKLAAQDGLTGVGLGEPHPGEFEIVVFVEAEDSPVRRKVPDVWEEFPVSTVISGRPRKY